MASAFTPSAPAGAPAKCRICGKPATLGAPLCLPCKSAVKRARQVPTVMSRFMPLAMSGFGSAGGNPANAGVVHARAHPPRARRPKPTAWSAFAAFAGFGLAVCVAGYFTSLQFEDDPDLPEIMPAATVAPHAASRAGGPAPPASGGVEAVAPTLADLPQAGHGSASAPGSTAGTSHGRAAASRPATRRETPPAPTSGPSTDIDESAATAGAPEERAMPATPAPPVPAPVVPDRWEAMSAAIAHCGRADFFSGIICEQRARMKYCDGYWGEVPQCRSGIRFEGGR